MRLGELQEQIAALVREHGSGLLVRVDDGGALLRVSELYVAGVDEGRGERETAILNARAER